MYTEYTELFGVTFNDWAAIKFYWESKGFSGAKEFLSFLEQKAEYQATNGLLLARLDRIKKLAEFAIIDGSMKERDNG